MKFMSKNENVSAVDLVKRYGEGATQVTALDNVSLTVEKGTFVAIMGPSGSGKSTLMQCMAGLDTVDSGQVFIGGTEITKMPDRELTRLRRQHVGFVFQQFNLVPTLTAQQNIVLPLTLARRKVDEAWFASVVETLGIAQRVQHKPHELSGGQQQRVAIARALVARPTVVFADEPTGSLDSHSGTEVLRVLRDSVVNFNQTVIMVTHDPVAASYADRVVMLADGRIVEELTAPSLDDIMNALRRVDVAV
jgi:hypothetical protein